MKKKRRGKEGNQNINYNMTPNNINQFPKQSFPSNEPNFNFNFGTSQPGNNMNLNINMNNNNNNDIFASLVKNKPKNEPQNNLESLLKF